MKTVYIVLMILCSEDGEECSAGRSHGDRGKIQTYEVIELCEMDRPRQEKMWLMGTKLNWGFWSACVPIKQRKR